MHKKTKLKTRNKVTRSTTVTLPAPVVMIPDKDDKPVPVLTDRHFLVDIMAKIEKENYVLLKYYLVDGFIKLKLKVLINYELNLNKLHYVITICNIILILVYVWLIIERMIISMRSIECKNQVMIIVVVVILVYEYTVFYTFHNHHSE